MACSKAEAKAKAGDKAKAKATLCYSYGLHWGQARLRLRLGIRQRIIRNRSKSYEIVRNHIFHDFHRESSKTWFWRGFFNVNIENLILTRFFNCRPQLLRIWQVRNPNHVGTHVGTRRDTSGHVGTKYPHVGTHVGTRRDTSGHNSWLVEIGRNSWFELPPMY